jgi:homopolymeric O-antigen transport system permease protein
VSASPVPVTERVPVIMLRASRGMSALDLGSLWAFRELLYFLTWRDIKVRYKQTVLGGLWAVIQPLFTMLIFTLFFGRLAGMPSDGVPYALFSYAALVPWTFFTNAMTNASNSLVGSANLITKVYFPRLLVPIASVLSALVDVALSSVLLFAMMGYYDVAPSLRILWLPAFLLLAVGAALGAGLWLSSLNVQFRDVRYTLPFLTQLWLFATPIAYPSSLLKEPWHTLYGLNPMVGVVEGFRWSLLPGRPAPLAMIELSVVSTLLILVSGAYYFRRMERIFADVV